MDSSIKDEFKDFISELSIEICKRVLIEDLKRLSVSFMETSDNYTSSIKEIKNELNQLQTTNEKLDNFVSDIDINNDRINRSLLLISGNHKKVIDNITSDNKKLFDEYSEKVQQLNRDEREKFISEISSSLNKCNEKYMSELKSMENTSSVEAILKAINLVFNQQKDLDYQIKNIGAGINHTVDKNIIKIERLMSDKIDILTIREKSISDKIDELNNMEVLISNKMDILNSNYVKFSNKLEDKYKIYKILLIAILVILGVIFVRL